MNQNKYKIRSLSFFVENFSLIFKKKYIDDVIIWFYGFVLYTYKAYLQKKSMKDLTGIYIKEESLSFMIRPHDTSLLT